MESSKQRLVTDLRRNGEEAVARLMGISEANFLEGRYENGSWQALRIWNGDQTDRGLNFKGSHPEVIRIRLHAIELYDRSVARPGPN